jgi:TolB-like protein
VLNTGAGREIFGLGAATKPVDVASLAAPARLAGRPSIAVLPFKNLSSDPSQDYFSDGITEDVITALGRFSNLLVIAKSASFPFKDSKAAPAEIGRLLDARYLLEGSVRHAGDRVRVSVELTEATTGRHVWSETYDAEADDIFAGNGRDEQVHLADPRQGAEEANPSRLRANAHRLGCGRPARAVSIRGRVLEAPRPCADPYHHGRRSCASPWLWMIRGSLRARFRAHIRRKLVLVAPPCVRLLLS